jgi:hypothetical protein
MHRPAPSIVKTVNNLFFPEAMVHLMGFVSSPLSQSDSGPLQPHIERAPIFMIPQEQLRHIVIFINRLKSVQRLFPTLPYIFMAWRKVTGANLSRILKKIYQF